VTRTPRSSFGDRIARRLVRLLPAQFRFDFRAPIEADLDERVRDDDHRGLMRHDVPSLLKAVVREHVASFFSTLRDDVRYAFRMMWRAPGFTTTAVVMLALGTGVNAALFSVIDAVMLRTPFIRPEQIALVQTVDGARASGAITPERFDALAASPGPLSAVAASSLGPHILTGAGEPRNVDVECVSASMFDVLGTPPMLGRTFSEAEDRPGAMATLVASYSLWQILGGSAEVVGSTVTINQTPVLVAGVMPPSFAGPRSRSDVMAWLPVHRPITGGGATGCAAPRFFNVYARVRDGMTIGAARSWLPGFNLVPLDDLVFEDLRRPFLVLTSAVACILLIACFNVGGLQMERTLARRREMALRLALGANVGRLVRQTLTENVILALIGAAAGLASTWLTLRALISLLPSNLPHLDQIAINARVLGVTVLVASAAGIVAGLLPIGQLRRVSPGRDLTASTRTGARQGTWTRRGLVATEIALSVVVLIGAALMMQTLVTLRFQPLGFAPEHKMSLLIRLPGATPDASATFFANLFDRLHATAGRRDVVGSTYLPMRGTVSIATVVFGDRSVDVFASDITPGYVELMKIRLRAGRAFTAADSRGAEPVAIVNEALAKRIQPDGQVLGQLISVPPVRRPSEPVTLRRIVGIATNTRSAGFDTRSRDEVYVPYAQDPGPVLFVITESPDATAASVAAELRAAVRAIGPNLAIDDVELIPDMLDRSVRFWRFGAWLLGVLAALAVVLTAIGLMTTIGWWVKQRTRELGLRIALGATRGTVTGLVFRQGLAIAVVGIVVGCAIAAGATRYLQGWIYGVTPLDPKTFVACSAGMLLVAVLAISLPVRRATSVDPVVALRTE
jgi:putative ABC transport system permease protein